jgi:asparagine synthase (glutamine-hydrolysing)
MCGITGIFSPSSNIINIGTQVNQMSERIKHRGPDGEGLWIDESNTIALGHRRLAIIDLSQDGAQPMSSSCGRYTMVFNGEIYNYLEIRSQLEKKGNSFRGRSDSEVLISAIATWGLIKALDSALGMFAIALWDKKLKTLSLVRDRAGKKPLYYCLSNKSLYFSSEIKSFKNLEGVSLSVSHEAISHYLSLSFIPSPLTIYNEIQEVVPGSVMSFNRGLSESTYRYWKFPEPSNYDLSFSDAVHQTDLLLTDAVKIRLRADVDVGVYLSGGIDSGLLTAMASNVSETPIKTFTVGFEGGSEFDETSLARLVSQRYKTDHETILLSSNVRDLLPKVVDAYDEPFGDPSALPTFAVSMAASKKVTVVLNGEGADELYGGYRRHMAVKLASKIAPFTNIFPDNFWISLFHNLPSPSGSRSLYPFIHRFLKGLGNDVSSQYISWTSDAFTKNDKSKFLSSKSIFNIDTEKYLLNMAKDIKSRDLLSKFMIMDFLIGMSDCLLPKIDIATMAHSLEGRSPFLDHRVVELAAGLNKKVLMPSMRTTKPILRELAKKYLPDPIINAPKRGFEMPIVKLMNNDLYDLSRDMCLNKNGIVSDIFNTVELNDLFSKKPKNIKNEERRTKCQWNLMMLSMWEDQNK